MFMIGSKFSANDLNLEPFSIIHAQDDLLYTADGRTLIDLFTAHGTVWLGHRRKEVGQAIAEQLNSVWITGGHPTPAVQLMRDTVNDFLPEGYCLASLASTGMEANEQAFRIARVSTRRNNALGLLGAMHGKSFATASLAWDNADGLEIPQIHRVASGPDQNESTMLDAIENSLRSYKVAAIYIEPIHGTSLGWQATPAFYKALRGMTLMYGAMLIYDEVLTGFFRTGSLFRFMQHEVEPDVIVFGKACGNGFPVAGVAVNKDISIVPRMLLGSTYSNNALAAAAVNSTLLCLRALNPENLVVEIEQIVIQYLGWLTQGDMPRMRGAGAMWVISLDLSEQAYSLAVALHKAGICIGHNGAQLRLLPPITIDLVHLRQACEKISEETHKILAT
jgi:4-aminobutyrate aminotransferase-like enzyme